MIIQNLSYPIERAGVSDFSTMSTYQRCGLKGFMQYSINRSPCGVNFPIQFGVAYHKFREILEISYKKAPPENLGDREWQQKIYTVAWRIASLSFVDPPHDHKKAYLTTARLESACSQAFDIWLNEKASNRYEILFSEQSFDLELPSGRRFGGRFDQILEWNGNLWVRDFKTTSRMGKTYSQTFDPHNQMTGYVWAAQILSGRRVEGVIADVVYNTKNQGPTFHEFLATRNTGHIERWVQTVDFELGEIDRMHEEMCFPMRTGACHDFGGCYFRDCCKKTGWYMMEKWLASNTDESHWDFSNPDAEEGSVD